MEKTEKSQCFAGSHDKIPPANKLSDTNNSKLERYVDWLNEEKFKERKDLIKLLMTLATAILTFTVGFRKDIIGSDPPNHIEYLHLFWYFQLATIILSFLYYILEYRTIFFLRLKKVTDKISWTHRAGKLEEMVYTIVVWITPFIFLFSLVFITLFVVHNTR